VRAKPSCRSPRIECSIGIVAENVVVGSRVTIGQLGASFPGLSNPSDCGCFTAVSVKPTSTLSPGSEDELWDRLAGLARQLSRQPFDFFVDDGESHAVDLLSGCCLT
jgi:hypothetical protein